MSPRVVRLQPVHWGLVAAALVVAAACLWVALGPEPPLPAVDSALAGTAARETFAVAAPAADSTRDELVERNPFSPTRAAPERPWTPADTLPPAPPPGAGNPAAAQQPGPPAGPPIRLLGTVVARVAAESFALIEADPARPGPELYHVGDSVGGYRLRAVLHDKVKLSRKDGELDLSLMSDAPRHPVE